MQIIEPTLLLDEKKCQENINFMVQKAKRSNVIFRPHFKTHQSIEVGRWFRAQGVDKITVSSLRMAKYLADSGWILPEQLCPVVSVSQEHGVIRVDENTFAEISVGDVVGVLPVHSCLTANLMKFYITLDGKVLEQMCEGNRNI
ncbi:MAG: hypothetical protein H0Z30_09405 [Candidatus Marinimicrobia bacterium]|nr:hypothetical protein [Candidatus Neomarinimicrobiota bacterium]